MKFTVLLLTSCWLGINCASYHSNFLYDEYEDDNCQMKTFPPNPNSSCCGIDTTSTYSIVGGDQTDLKQYPWMAYLLFEERNSSEMYQVCDAFLISGKYVLSAAHCFVKEDRILKKVVLGDYDMSNEGRDCVRVDDQKECTEGHLNITVESFTVHENYNSDTFDNDIALIKLKKNAPYRDYIRPICLPTSDVTDNPPEGLTFTSAGWGVDRQIYKKFTNEYIDEYPTIKRHVHLPYVSKEICNNVWNDLPEKHLCAGGEEGKDVCMGDSGGPLMYDNDGIYEAVGIVSFGPGKPCGKQYTPGAYTNVYKYKEWIYKKINELEYKVQYKFTP